MLNFDFILMMYFLVSVLMIPIFNPLALSFLLVLMSLLTSLILAKINIWLFYSILLIFIGGMMVLILYATSLTENEKFNTYFLFPKFSILLSSLSLSYYLVKEINTANSIYFLYNKMGNNLLYFLIFYLLMILFICVKFSESFKGTLQKAC